jgi:phospholipid transport system substrate-binding protein
MPTLRALPWTVTGILLLTIPLSIGAAESPRDTLRSTIERLVMVLRDPTLQGDGHRQERVEKVQELVRPQFAFLEMAQQALGTYWRDRTEAEQREFVRLFTDLLEQAYSGILESSAAEVQIRFDHERIQGSLAEVDTQVLSSPHDQPVAITYRLRDVGGQWLVYDVVIDQMSLVRNYGAQFRRMLDTSSFADLVQELKSKLRELEVAPLA